MIKRVLLSGGVLLGAAYLGCGGDSGSGKPPLTQKPSVITDRNLVADTLCKGALRRQTLIVTNGGVEDLVINSVTLSSTNPAVVTGGSAAFQLLANGVLPSNPDGGPGTIVTPVSTLKSNQSGFVSLLFTSPDAGNWVASLNLATNATNVNGGGAKAVELLIIAPDAGTQGCAP